MSPPPTDIAERGSSARTILFAALVTIAFGAVWLSAGSVYLPHVDDFYIIAWAKAVADGDTMPVHALSRFYPQPEYFHIAPRLHIYALSAWIDGFGWNLDSLLAFRATMFVLTSGIVAAAALRLRRPLVAVLFPIALLVTMLHSGQRPDSTALLLVIFALAVLWTDAANGHSHGVVLRTLAKTAAVLAPLAWPSALAYGAAMLIVSDLRDVRRKPLAQLVLEDAIALAAGVVVLGLMVGFDYLHFVRAYLRFTAEHDDILSLNRMRLGTGIAFLAAAALVRRRAPDAAFLASAVGVGALIGLALHTKFAISTPLNVLAVLAIVDGATQTPRGRRLAWGGAAAAFAVMLTNQVIFAVAARPSPEAAAAVRAFAEQARREGRVLLADEIGATYGLGLDIAGVYSWSFSEHHPKSRPPSIETIREGESWIISAYTVHGWLKSTGVAGFPARRADVDRFLPGTPCLSGRNSCRLPALRWAYYLVERRNGAVSVKSVP